MSSDQRVQRHSAIWFPLPLCTGCKSPPSPDLTATCMATATPLWRGLPTWRRCSSLISRLKRCNCQITPILLAGFVLQLHVRNMQREEVLQTESSREFWNPFIKNGLEVDSRRQSDTWMAQYCSTVELLLNCLVYVEEKLWFRTLWPALHVWTG